MPRRVLEGEVVSTKTDKTVTVLVERRYRHPVYKKYIKRTDKYAAHDEANQFAVGDRIQIIECRPISKTKRWTVVTGDLPSSSQKAEEKKVEPKKAAASKAKSKASTAKKSTSKKTTSKKDKKD